MSSGDKMKIKKAKQKTLRRIFFPGCRKGTHVEVVLSFAIFVIFLIFLLSSFNQAVESSRGKQHILDNLKPKLLDLSSTEITTFTIEISGAGQSSHGCVRINSLPNEINLYKLIIKDNLGNILAYSIQNFNSIRVSVGQNFNGLLKFYYSDDGSNSMGSVGGGCQPINQNDYTIRTITREYNSQAGILNRLENYGLQYEYLKAELGVPGGTDFGFNFTYSNGSSVGTEMPSVSRSVYSDESNIFYTDENAEINVGVLKIFVW